MSAFWILLIISWLIIIFFPQIIAYMLGGLLIFFGLNIVLAKFMISRWKNKEEDYVKFWKYKIYKD